MRNTAFGGVTSNTASGNMSGECVTTLTGHISSASGNIQTNNESLAGEGGYFQSLACTGHTT